MNHHHLGAIVAVLFSAIVSISSSMTIESGFEMETPIIQLCNKVSTRVQILFGDQESMKKSYHTHEVILGPGGRVHLSHWNNPPQLMIWCSMNELAPDSDDEDQVSRTIEFAMLFSSELPDQGAYMDDGKAKVKWEIRNKGVYRYNSTTQDWNIKESWQT